MSTKAPVDWAAIEREYRLGERSLRDIGREFGVSDKGIAKHATKHGWKQQAAVRSGGSRKPSAPIPAARTANRVKGTSGLTPKQERFCIEYMKSANPIASYRQSYDAAGSSDATANRRAQELLADSAIAARIKELRDAAAMAAAVTQGQVLAEVARLGLSDAGALFDACGDLLPIKDLPIEIRACIASVEIDDRIEGAGDNARAYRVKKVKLWDKNSALEKLMKHLGMYEKDNKQKAGIFDQLPKDEVERIVERLRALNRPGVAGPTVPSGASRFTH